MLANININCCVVVNLVKRVTLYIAIFIQFMAPWFVLMTSQL